MWHSISRLNRGIVSFFARNVRIEAFCCGDVFYFWIEAFYCGKLMLFLGIEAFYCERITLIRFIANKPIDLFYCEEKNCCWRKLRRFIVNHVQKWIEAEWTKKAPSRIESISCNNFEKIPNLFLNVEDSGIFALFRETSISFYSNPKSTPTFSYFFLFE